MQKWAREIAVGGGAAALVLVYLAGFDITVLLLPVSLVVLAALVLSRGAPWQTKFSLAGLGDADNSKIPLVTFADIGGLEMAKREFVEALTFLKETENTARLGIRPIKGILLAGPPGTGKTLMAKAAANYTGSAFVTASGSQFVQMYAGVGASRVRQIFKEARSLAEQKGKRSAIIFIDEIDVLGVKRGQHQSHLEYDQTLNELLAQIDGVQSSHTVQVLVVGATNRSDLLDPALLRPGRFDRIVQVDLPDKKGRLHILQIHARGKPLAAEVDLASVAAETFGFSGAHLENLLNEAAINALRQGRQEITSLDISEAIEKVMLGEKSCRTPSAAEKERIACHEVGHALISETVRPGSVASISITSRSNALGYIRQNPQKDQYLYTKEELINNIQVCVAGAVSEELILGQRSTGAVGDIKQAVDLAKKMVFAGLSSRGIVSSELPNNILHDTIAEIIGEQEQAVKSCLEKHINVIREIAAYLLEQESISGAEFRRRLNSGRQQKAGQ
ncbi:MAG TPA: AAA family ATPase [Firmicutes bacterium]|nr:AAA family ATPase [Bacillota bacterium]